MLSGLASILKENDVQKEVFVQVNPFLFSSSKALQLIAGLNVPKGIAEDETNVFFHLDELINSDEFESDFNEVYPDYKSMLRFRSRYEQMKIDVTSSKDEDWTKIVLGGEFSSGKSSFLNSLLCGVEEDEFLPVSDKPTSVIPTFIYCSEKHKKQYVIGENKQQGKIFLSTHALLALGHDFERKHNISLAMFLNKLIIQQPIKEEFLNEVMFIDTPGYSKEDGESKTDQQTAIEAVKQGEVLFWLIDIDSGTIKKQDLDFIKNNFDVEKPKVIIFNKADKKSATDIKIIIEQAGKSLNIKSDETIIDIIAYSSHDRQILGSYRGNTSWKAVFEKVKSKASKKKAEQYFIEHLIISKKRIEKKIDSKIKDNNKLIKIINKKIIDLQNKENTDLSYIKQEINYYNNVAWNLQILGGKFIELAASALDREAEWSNKTGMFAKVGSLKKEWELDVSKYTSLCEEYDNTVIEDLNSFIPVALDNIEYELDCSNKIYLIDDEKARREELRDEIGELTERLYKFNERVNVVEILLRRSIKSLRESRKENNYSHLSTIGIINSKGDVFNCITQNDYDGFLDWLSEKRDISDLKDAEGHNILSLAVKNRRHDMVSVLLPKAYSLINKKEGALLSAKEIAENNQDHLMLELFNNLSNTHY